MLDVGAAFGFGTSFLAGSRRVSWIAGLERDSTYVADARQRYPTLSFTRADATQLPIHSASVHAVTLLDVLEHLDHPDLALAEAARVLRPGGALVLSVPHAGPLAVCDSLNVYDTLRRRWPTLPPLAASEASGTGTHRHYSVAQITALLGPRFEVDQMRRTGLGIAELIHVVVLALCRGLLHSEPSYLRWRNLYFVAYVIEDLLPAGPFGYHLTLRAHRR